MVVRMTSRDLSLPFRVPFRPMVMHYLNNVSILFADIVGFTKMSSSRSAIEIVSMLNTICDSFDRLVSTGEEGGGC